MPALVHGRPDQHHLFADGAVQWIDNPSLFLHTSGAACIDLHFEPSEERIQILRSVGGLVIINSMLSTLEELSLPAVRIAGWEGFLQSDIIEAAGAEALRPDAETLFSSLGKKLLWVPDDVGFVTPRVVASIINEAYLALEEGVASREDIDLSMKLGTAYPYGPFEWAERIGKKEVCQLLQKLSVVHDRYTPAQLLVEEAL